MWTLLYRNFLLAAWIGCCYLFQFSAFAFAPSEHLRIPFASLRPLSMMVPVTDTAMVPPPPFSTLVESSSLFSLRPATGSATSLETGIRSYVVSTAPSQPTLLVALQERKIPTKEEIDQKKMTFNMVFWGGGFVAPLLATIFYFGFRFWEK